MEIKIFPLGPLETNCFVIVNGNKAIAIDPGGDPSHVLSFLKKTGVELERILNTHLHFDHTLGNKALADATEKQIYASNDDLVLMDTQVGRGGLMGYPEVPEFEFEHIGEGETELIGLECKIYSTPGHTPGSLTFHFPALKSAFVGDLIFRRSIGRTDFPYGCTEDLLTAVREKIFTLPAETELYAGHGPSTSVGDEINHNPYFSGVHI
ncbi:MBL fold metallo-hydrolase [Maridesulfovibrio sp.]|uniref:MBL fold metallo-hydrolase n=1 Tax=Maridesulfovibrio sp. TaxID=2795000 RepID=UPI0039EF5747